MKKALIGALVLLLAGAGGYWFFFHSPRDYPEKILPENTVAYLYFSGVDRVEKNGKDSLLWQRIANSPRKELYLRQLNRMLSVTESVVGVDPRPLLTQFTREVAIAVLPVTTNTQAGVLVAYVRKQKDATEFVELRLDPSLKRRFPDLKKAPASYLDVEYYKYSSKSFDHNLSPCYVLMDHHLILTSTESAMKIILDVKGGKLSPLKKGNTFKTAGEELKSKEGILFFVNGAEALKVLQAQLTGVLKQYSPAVVKITGADAIKGFAYSIDFYKEGFREEGFLLMDRNRSGLAKAYMEQKPQKLAGLTFAPSTSQAAGASTLPDGAVLWKEIQAQTQSVLSDSKFSQWKAMLELLTAMIQFDFQRDLIELIGRQFSFAYDQPAGSNDPKATRYLFALEIKNPDRFRDSVERLIRMAEARGLSRKPELYQGKTLQILTLPMGSETASPTYWFEGAWFYVGTHADFVKTSIDSMKNKKNLSESADFKKVTHEFPAEVNGISYTNTSVTLQRYASALQIESTQEEQKWILESGLLQEMNDLSKALFGSGSYTIIEKDGVRYHAYSSVPTSFFVLPTVFSAMR